MTGPAGPDLLRAGDGATIEHLFEGLVMAGIAMQISGSSRPASGSEHRFSHLWEMQALGHGHEAVPHGFKVGVGTSRPRRYMSGCSTRDLRAIDVESLVPRLAVARRCRATGTRGARASGAGRKRGRGKPGQIYRRPAAARAPRQCSVSAGQTLREQLRAQLLPAAQLREMLQAAGCPTDPRAIGVDLARLRQSYLLARTIRARYTVLDLVYETGIFDDCVAELFAPDGFWSMSNEQ